MDDGDVEAAVGFWDALRDALSDLPAATVQGLLIDEPLPWPGRVLTWLLVKPYYAMVGDDEKYEKRVNTFYLNASENFSIILVVAMNIGLWWRALHWMDICFSLRCRAAGRVASLSITSVPTVIPLPFVTFKQVPDRYRVPDSCGYITFLLPLLYAPSRLVLLVVSRTIHIVRLERNPNREADKTKINQGPSSPESSGRPRDPGYQNSNFVKTRTTTNLTHNEEAGEQS